MCDTIVALCCGYSVQLDNTGDPFRSGVLGVMSPARFLCATPVKCNDIDSEFRSHDIPNKLSKFFR